MSDTGTVNEEVKQALAAVWTSLSQDLHNDLIALVDILMRSSDESLQRGLLQLIINRVRSEIRDGDEAGHPAVPSFEEMSRLNDQIATIQAGFSQDVDHAVPTAVPNVVLGQDDAGATSTGAGVEAGANDEASGLPEHGTTQDGAGSLTYRSTTGTSTNHRGLLGKAS